MLRSSWTRFSPSRGAAAALTRLSNNFLPHYAPFQVWIMAAQFEVRQLRLDAARKILGMAIGMCPKVGTACRPLSAAWLMLRLWEPWQQRLLHGCCGWSKSRCVSPSSAAQHLPSEGLFTRPIHLPQDKLFKSYIEMELQLGNIERCRTLYQKYIEWSPANAAAWGRWAGTFPCTLRPDVATVQPTCFNASLIKPCSFLLQVCGPGAVAGRVRAGAGRL